jgi:thiol-disulfide isomerase/thioredoxin
MKALSLTTALLFLSFAQSSMAGFFDLAPEKLPYAAPDVQFISNSKPHSLKEYKGRKVMLWLFSTWCHTCIASVRLMRDKQPTWEKTGLVIIALRNYKNGGYPGPDMATFMEKVAPQIKNKKNWITGEATEEMDQQFNAKKHPDIYFLIDENGVVQNVSTAPTATMKKILNFAHGTSR